MTAHSQHMNHTAGPANRLLYPLSAGQGMRLIGAIALVMSAFHLYTGGMGTFTALIQRGVHLSFALALIYLRYPSGRFVDSAKGVFAPDLLLAIISILPGAYLAVYYEEIAERGGMATDFELLLGGLTVILLMEAVRRVVGWPLFFIALGALLYCYFGPYLPGPLEHRGYSLERISYQMFLSESGIMGIPLGVSATIIALFIMFGSFLEQSGGSKYFIDMATTLTSRSAGGPAKAAVVASGLMGTISGSAVANVVTTGNLTIPLMIRAGYTRVFAGAVEAVASSGGQLAPPIMGAAAFLMADMTGIPYVRIMLGACIPALLFYGCLFMVVHFEAIRVGLRGTPNADRSSASRAREGLHMFAPVVILIVLLSMEFSPTYVGFWTIVGMIAISWLRPQTRLTPPKIKKAMVTGALSMLPVTTACATAGIVVGAVTLTGLPIKFSSLLIQFAGGSLIVLLLLTMAASIVLGMGLPTAPAYILLATLVGPALTEMGVPLLAAHMFIFFFGVVSAITPPVALAAYAAAGISEADPNAVGFKACWIGLATFIIPYMFIYAPELLGIGDVFHIALSSVLAGVGVTALAVCITGCFRRPCTLPERVAFGIGALLLLHPAYLTGAVGIGILCAAAAVHIVRTRRLCQKTAETITDTQEASCVKEA